MTKAQDVVGLVTTELGAAGKRLAVMLERQSADEVLHAIDTWLTSCEPTISDLATLDVLITRAEAQAGQDHRDHMRLGLAGDRQKSLHRAERKIGEIKLRLWERIGKFVDSLPPDPGGRPADGEPEPVRRQARRELGLDRDGVSGLVELARAPAEDLDAYVEKIRHGSPVPRSPKAAARAVVRHAYGSGECYTPPVLLSAARKALGVAAFGEDPSSNWAAQTCLVKAERWRCLGRPEWGPREEDYSRIFEADREDFDDELHRWGEVDGLHELPWAPGWWCNPDYAAGIVDKFAARATAEAEAGRPGILLVNCATSAEWQQLLLSRWPRVWLRDRIAFYSANGEQTKGNQWPSVVFGLGVEEHRFIHAFRDHGALGFPGTVPL